MTSPPDALDLLASAHAIAQRRGAGTNWPAFTDSVEKCLTKHGRSTATTRTFRLVVDEHDPNEPSQN
jgi:hypothetical protein